MPSAGPSSFDDKFLEAAVNGRADVIVTGDTDLLDLNPFRGGRGPSPPVTAGNARPLL